MRLEYGAADVRQLVFYHSHWLVQVCGIELSCMGNNNENPDMVCETYRIALHNQEKVHAFWSTPESSFSDN